MGVVVNIVHACGLEDDSQPTLPGDSDPAVLVVPAVAGRSASAGAAAVVFVRQPAVAVMAEPRHATVPAHIDNVSEPSVRQPPVTLSPRRWT